MVGVRWWGFQVWFKILGLCLHYSHGYFLRASCVPGTVMGVGTEQWKNTWVLLSGRCLFLEFWSQGSVRHKVVMCMGLWAACHGGLYLCQGWEQHRAHLFPSVIEPSTLGWACPLACILILLLIGDNFSGHTAPRLHGNTSKYSSGDLCSTF